MNAQALESLVQHTVRAAVAGELDAHGLANVVYGAACIDMGKSLGALFAALAKEAEPRLGEFNA